MSKGRYHTLSNVLATKTEIISWSKQWQNAFGTPANCGMWFIWGNSGNGKSSFCMQLAKELARLMVVLYLPLEEEYASTFQDLLVKTGMAAVKKNIRFHKSLTPDTLNKKLKGRNSPKAIIIDSEQVFIRKYEEVQKLLESHPDKLFIFVSQSEGKTPRGKAAVDTKFYAHQKIWVEGYKAISHGRNKPGGEYTIWETGAATYWGTKGKKADEKQ